MDDDFNRPENDYNHALKERFVYEDGQSTVPRTLQIDSPATVEEMNLWVCACKEDEAEVAARLAAGPPRTRYTPPAKVA